MFIGIIYFFEYYSEKQYKNYKDKFYVINGYYNLDNFYIGFSLTFLCDTE